MSASEPIVRGASAPEAGGSDAEPPEQPTSFEAALDRLAQAVARRKAEPICIAYLLLRRAGRGMSVRKVLDAADKATGGKARGVIVSAYTQRRCYMCRDGSSRCKTCQGTGAAEGKPCPQCDGLGVEPCDFCMGAAWSDLDQVPPELRPAVAHRRLAHVEKELRRLSRLPGPEQLRSMQINPDQRSRLATWLMRLRGRLVIPAGVEGGNGRQRAEQFAAAIETVGRLLDAIRPPQAGPAD